MIIYVLLETGCDSGWFITLRKERKAQKVSKTCWNHRLRIRTQNPERQGSGPHLPFSSQDRLVGYFLELAELCHSTELGDTSSPRGYLFLLIGLLSPQLTHPANHCYSAAQSCPTLCNPMDCSTPGFLSFTSSQSLLTLMSIESVIPSNHLILCHPLLLLPSIFPRIQVFSNESANWH